MRTREASGEEARPPSHEDENRHEQAAASDSDVEAALARFSTPPPTDDPKKPATLEVNRDAIDAAFKFDSVEEIISTLMKLAIPGSDEAFTFHHALSCAGVDVLARIDLNTDTSE